MLLIKFQSSLLTTKAHVLPLSPWGCSGLSQPLVPCGWALISLEAGAPALHKYKHVPPPSAALLWPTGMAGAGTAGGSSCFTFSLKDVPEEWEVGPSNILIHSLLICNFDSKGDWFSCSEPRPPGQHPEPAGAGSVFTVELLPAMGSSTRWDPPKSSVSAGGGVLGSRGLLARKDVLNISAGASWLNKGVINCSGMEGSQTGPLILPSHRDCP